MKAGLAEKTELYYIRSIEEDPTEITPDKISAECALLRTEELRKTYTKGGKELPACENISFSVNKGEFVCIVGPSGCGKTTLLKCVCHLLNPTSGKVFVNENGNSESAEGDDPYLSGL